MFDPLKELDSAGVSIWLDMLSRDMLTSGELIRYRDRHISGVTTNPTIFAKALADGHAYDEQLAQLAAASVAEEDAIFDVMIADVQSACDVLAPVFSRTGGLDGRVSIEVRPGYAYATEATVAEAIELTRRVDRENLMVKIPATREGLAAITEATAAAVNVNVTLIFSQERYREVAEAYVEGLRRAHANGHDLASIRSTASIFLSRIDTKVDAALEENGSDGALELRGQAAIANARLCYRIAEEVFGSAFADLAALGAHPQRPLWASTGTKSDRYRQTLYVDTLVAPGVVSTIPPATLEHVASDLTEVPNTIAGTYAQSEAVLAKITEYGVDLAAIMETLEAEGVESFNTSWAELLTDVRAGMDREVER